MFSIIVQGMKFAMNELKLTLIKMLQNFEVCASENTPQTLEYTEGFVRLPKQPIKVIFKKR